MSEVYKAPEHEAFHFGLYFCAYCLGQVSPRARVTWVLKEPVFGDQARTEILIPSGRQSFHRDCLAKHREDVEPRPPGRPKSVRGTAARALRAKGMTLREIGKALGISHEGARLALKRGAPCPT